MSRRHPLLLSLPGFRRYAHEISRLRRRLDEASGRVRELKEAEGQQRRRVAELSQFVREQETQLAELRAELDRVRAAAAAAAEARVEKLLGRANRFDYYWYNAAKKMDLREVEGFGPLAERIRSEGRTFLHLDRLYTLWQAVSALPSHASAVAEVGAFRGGSARFIAEAMRAKGRELPFYVCDTFRGHVAVDGSIDGRHQVGKQFSAAKVERVADYLQPFDTVRLLDGDIRETSALLREERGFGLVHIDVDVYPITRFCLEFFAPRLVAGGTMVVDDYGFTTCQGAKKAVDEFVAADGRFRMLHLLTGQAVLTAG